MRTSYVGHDRQYRKHRAQGKPGWDASGSGYTEFRDHVEGVMARGNAPRFGRLLELGCGAGNMTVWFAKKGYEAHGIDIAPAAIDWANEKAENAGVQVRFKVGDVVTLGDYPDSHFDFVFDGHCLHCIIGDDRAWLLANVYRILRPGGYLMVNTMCGPVDANKLEHYDLGTRCTFIGDVATRYFGAADDILAEITSAGFEVIQVDFGKDDEDQPNHDLVVEARKPTQKGATQPDAPQDAESAGASFPPVR